MMTESDNIPTFKLKKHEKEEFLLDKLNHLTEFHLENCQEYNSLMDKFKTINVKAKRLEDVPFLPVRLFKYIDLLSIPENKVIKTTYRLNKASFNKGKYRNIIGNNALAL